MSTRAAAGGRLCRNKAAPRPPRTVRHAAKATRTRLSTLAEFLREAAGRRVAFDCKWRKNGVRAQGLIHAASAQ